MGIRSQSIIAEIRFILSHMMLESIHDNLIHQVVKDEKTKADKIILIDRVSKMGIRNQAISSHKKLESYELDL